MKSSLIGNLGQLFMIGVSGHSLTSEEKLFLKNEGIGGVVLFSRNVQSPDQVKSLCEEIQSLKNNIPFFIGVDMEGGRVARLKDPFTVWPPMSAVGHLNSASLAFKFAESMGKELSAVGINLNFAPSLDVLTNPANSAIGDRSFGSDPQLVSKMGSAVVRGFVKANIIPCIKHFPGHGNTVVDSHFELPKESLSLEQIDVNNLQTFKKVFRSRVDLVMTSHILFTQIDDQNPVTLSYKWLTKILRETLGYRELIITDDLDMKGLRNHYSVEEIAIKAIQAGVNILLYCNEPQSPVLALEALKKGLLDQTLDSKLIELSVQKVLELKAEKLKIQPIPNWKEWIGHRDHKDLSLSIKEGRLPTDMKT